MRLLVSLLLFTAFTTARAQSADEKAVLAAEKTRFEAQVAKNFPVLEKVLADDLVYTHSNGNTDSKQSYIQAIKDGKSSYLNVDVKEQKVRLYGNMAIINGLADVKTSAADGKVNDMKLKYTDAYVKRNGQWQMVTWQSLRVTQ